MGQKDSCEEKWEFYEWISGYLRRQCETDGNENPVSLVAHQDLRSAKAPQAAN